MKEPKTLNTFKVKTRKTNSYPGDTWIGIDVILPNGYSITAFGLWPRSDKRGRYYESDNGGYYNTITEAKEVALNNAKKDYLELMGR